MNKKALLLIIALATPRIFAMEADTLTDSSSENTFSEDYEQNKLETFLGTALLRIEEYVDCCTDKDRARAETIKTTLEKFASDRFYKLNSYPWDDYSPQQNIVKVVLNNAIKNIAPHLTYESDEENTVLEETFAGLLELAKKQLVLNQPGMNNLFPDDVMAFGPTSASETLQNILNLTLTEVFSLIDTTPSKTLWTVIDQLIHLGANINDRICVFDNERSYYDIITTTPFCYTGSTHADTKTCKILIGEELSC